VCGDLVWSRPSRALVPDSGGQLEQAARPLRHGEVDELPARQPSGSPPVQNRSDPVAPGAEWANHLTLTVHAATGSAARTVLTILPGLALQAHRSPDVHTTELPDSPRQIYAVTYGNPPDPPATTALIQTIRESA
jgi:DNA-binding transcriptional LysR family regulator